MSSWLLGALAQYRMLCQVASEKQIRADRHCTITLRTTGRRSHVTGVGAVLAAARMLSQLQALCAAQPFALDAPCVLAAQASGLRYRKSKCLENIASPTVVGLQNTIYFSSMVKYDMNALP